MAAPTEAELLPSPTSSKAAAERRRPGRSETAHPNLIPLLRHPETRESAEVDLIGSPNDDLRPATGIAVALALSAPFWALFAYFVL